MVITIEGTNMILTRSIALLSFLVSQVTIAISYYIALQYDHPKVESCNPFFDGCLNITDAGIYSPEGFIFRGGMIAACAFFIMWWIASFERISVVVNKITIMVVSALNCHLLSNRVLGLERTASS